MTSAIDSPFARRPTIFCTRRLLVVLVNADDGDVDVEMPEQVAGPPRVFGRHQLDRFERLEGAKRDVFEIADGRGDYVEHSPQRHPAILSYHCLMPSFP